MTEKVAILPTCWGPPLWFSLHSIAFAYDPNSDRQKYYDFFSNLGYVLPCEECKVHYTQNFNKDEFARALESNEGLFRWVYDLHNRVNKGTGVPESKWPSYETVKKNYASFKASCSDMPGVCGSGSPNKKKIKIIEQFGEYQENLGYIIPIAILSILLVFALGFIWKNRKKLNA
jgi:hypothetical protein